jgi:puromycin-sensitive aminopeptidase
MQTRLYESLSPRRYELSLTVDPRRDEFQGRVLIEADNRRPTSLIVLHSNGLIIDKATVSGQIVDADKISFDAVEETVSLKLKTSLPPGPALIEIVYHAPFNQRMRGLYLAKARVNGQVERHAFTKFEPTACRQMLPCIDEPEAKAVFDLTVIAPKDMTVLANTPVLTQTTNGEFQTLTFGTTPHMSTYLLALLVSRMTSKSLQVGATKLSVWALPDGLAQADFALEAGRFCLEWLNEYFGMPYPLEKLDLVAVPEFSSNGMENWGLITFRDSAMLVDPATATEKALRHVATIVAHEIVHQWFGNLVTMRWWDDLWLNEAFATWMSYKVLDAWKPHWDIWLDFERIKSMALQVDALTNTRPITSDVSSISEILAMFDFLTYIKGGAVLRMVEGMVGEDRFRAGIRAYMKKHEYGSTVAADLWRALEGHSRTPVSAVAKGWLTRPGFPVLSARIVSAPRRQIQLSQRRFSAHGLNKEKIHWAVPLVLRYKLAGEKATRTHRLLLTKPMARLTLPGNGALQWIYPNSGESGFFRIDASKNPAFSIGSAVLVDLPPAERLTWLDDLWAQLRNSSLRLPDFLRSLWAFSNEGHWAILEALRSPLQALHDSLARTTRDRKAVAAYIQALLASSIARRGWEAAPGEDSQERRGRAAALAALATADPGPEFTAQASRLLKRYLASPGQVDPALASFALSEGARHGDIQLFQLYREKLTTASTPEVRDLFLDALGKFSSPKIADEILKLTLSDSVLGQDLWKPFIPAMRNPALQARSWKIVRKNWSQIRKKGGDRAAERIMEATSWFWTSPQRAEAKTFFTRPANRLPASGLVLRQTLEEMAAGIRLRQNNRRIPLADFKSTGPAK